MSIYGRGYSPRKAMAMGEGGYGDFGVGKFPAESGRSNPDAKMAHTEMPDRVRGAGYAIPSGKGPLPAQPYPDHGPLPKESGYRREAKA